jgi:ATP-dependent Clp protease adaptor protein ClpS
MVKEKTIILSDQKNQLTNIRELVLFNDDVNTFDYVIESLIEVCGIDPLQAEQITLVVHYKGKCGVMNGSLEELKPAYNEMINRKLTVSIE